MASQTVTPPAHHDGMLDKFTHIIQRSRKSKGDGNVIASGPTSPSLLSSILHDLESQEVRVPEDIGLVVSSVQTEIDGGLIDDKTYLVWPFNSSTMKIISFAELSIDRANNSARCLPSQ